MERRSNEGEKIGEKMGRKERKLEMNKDRISKMKERGKEKKRKY